MVRTTSAAAVQCRNHDLIQRNAQPLRISQDSIRIRGADMNFEHIHTFIPYAMLGAGLILVVSFFPPKGLDGTQGAPTAMWQTTVNTEGDTAPLLSPAGQPNQVCSAWLQDWSDPAKHEGQLEWILGFVTGSNYRSEGQGQPEDTDEVEVFIEHYCRNNPEHQLFMAAAALVQENGGPAALHEFTKEGDGDSGEDCAHAGCETAPGQELDLSRLRFTP
jgi:hypothetical protein